jgi:O-antigen/teichoic acid export membrane protein
VTVLSTSIAVTLPAAFVAGLRGWMLAGVAATLIGNAAYVGYRETMRGQERYIPMVAIYVVANLLELVAILIAAALGHRSPSLFLILYGLSYVVALLILLAATPLGLQLRLPSISVARVRTVIDFVAPLYLQTAFLTVWLGADLVIVNRLMSSASAGQYAAAKTLANVFYLAPNAIGGPLLPKVASLVRNEVRPYVLRVLTLVAVLTAPLLAALIIFRHPVFQLVYGSRYAEAAAPFAVLAVAMSLYGVYQVLEHTWIGRGRPVVDTVATGAGALVSLALLFVLVPRAGLNGAALAFLAGAIVQVLVIGGITLVALGGRDASDMIASPEGSDGRSA